jgi:thioredoxin-dependent peroxiredoxin
MEVSSLVGKPAPAFSAPDQDGKRHASEEFRGSWVLLYFYPKDDTPGCTKEACGLRDAFGELKARGVTIVGVSVDGVKSHRKFADKYILPFTLLADEEKKIVHDYGAWQEKSMYGKTYMGTARVSFLIDPEGIVRKAYPKVKPEEHAREILNDIEGLKN